MGKELFFFLEFLSVNAAPGSAHLHRMPQVQHLVVDEVLDRLSRNARVVEDAAHNDCIVRRVVVAQHVAGVIATPGHLRPCEKPVEKSEVQLVENAIEIVDMALGRIDALASAQLSNELGLVEQSLAADVFAVPKVVAWIDRLAVELSQKY